MRFHSLQVLWLFAPWVFLPTLWIFWEQRARERFSKFVSTGMLSKLVEGYSLPRKRLKFALVWLALGFSILAWSRPQIGMREEIVKSQGLDIVFLLDVSNSMTTEDVVPSRLKKAKHIIRNFLDRFSGDRVGVVAFAGSSYPAIPLTTDYDYIKQVMETLDEHSVAHQGTNLKAALETAMELIDRGGVNEDDETRESGGTKLLFILSDGEDHVGEEAKAMPQLNHKGIRIYCIGVGTTKGGPMPMRDDKGVLQGYKRDGGGNIILSKLESTALEALAKGASGKYYVASSNESEIDEITADLQGMTRTEGGSRRVIVYDEFFQLPLALALALLLLCLGLPDRVKARAVALVLVAAVALLATTPRAFADAFNDYQETKQGLESYLSSDFAGAVNHFGNAQATNPDSKINNFNLGTALLKTGNPERAVPELQEGTKATDPEQAAKSAYNLGRALDRQSQHEKAIQSYQKGLDTLKSQPQKKKETEEMIQRLKKALESSEEKRQQRKEDKGKPEKDKQGNGEGQQKQDQEQGKKEDKKYQIPKDKPKFKSEQLSEQDAKRLLQQLKEQENKVMQNLRRSKTQQHRKDSRDEKPGKDW